MINLLHRRKCTLTHVCVSKCRALWKTNVSKRHFTLQEINLLSATKLVSRFKAIYTWTSSKSFAGKESVRSGLTRVVQWQNHNKSTPTWSSQQRCCQDVYSVGAFQLECAQTAVVLTSTLMFLDDA